MTLAFHKCRLCLKLGDFCSIFDQDDTVKLSDMVMSFANVKIFEGDGFSDRVCTSCIENLSTAYLFKQQCERIDHLIRKSPDTDINKPPLTNYDDFFNKEFHVHTEYESGEDEKNESYDNNTNAEAYCGSRHEISDETDSDVDSIKCMACNQSYSNIGSHRCHTVCTIERNGLQQSSSSNETLVATDISQENIQSRPTPPGSTKSSYIDVSCLLCDARYDQYDSYVIHLNKCLTNVKLHHYVCPVCHEMYTDKLAYLEHLKVTHFSQNTVQEDFIGPGMDCIDFPIYATTKPKAVRRQIGWSVEDIYQEIDCKPLEKKETPTSSPLKTFFSKFGNETFSRQSTPKKVSFRKFIENGKAKTSIHLPFQKYIQNYKLKKKATAYSPIKGKLQVSTKIKASLPEVSDSDYSSPSGTSEESWKLKQNLICACDKKIFMLSESVKVSIDYYFRKFRINTPITNNLFII
ncbi:hypothetical protein O3G_MSEX012184 [Manduca sexta]|uniref:ZAD domain-containing protein n=1 Tax=Manduca sexta TaxID=7130 RepID=A0A921ZMI9_MANSE|nr:hypothetical protein O3G_MSEX012184 [Manduca sexta]